MQKAVKHTKGRLLREKLKISANRGDLKPVVRGLAAELKEELAEIEKQIELQHALEMKVKLEKKLAQVQDSITGLQPISPVDAAKTQLRQEDRRRAMQEEEEKRSEAALLAKRLRAEQIERERKRSEALTQQRLQEAEAQRLQAEAEQQRADAAKAEKSQQLQQLRELSQKRKQYLEVVKQRAVRKSQSEPRGSSLPAVSAEPQKKVEMKRYRKSPFLLRLEHEAYDQQRSLHEEDSARRRRLEMRKHYAEIVQEMFAPAVDLIKRKEIELALQREQCQLTIAETRKRAQAVRKSVGIGSVSVTPVRRPIVKQSQSTVPRVQPDFLSDVKQSLDIRIRRLLKSSATPVSPLPCNQKSAEVCERRAKARSALLKRLDPLSPAALQMEEDADELLLHSVKAKIAMLEE